MDGLFLACLMGICGVPVASGLPISTAQPVPADAPLPLGGAQTGRLAIEAPSATNQDVSGPVAERAAPRDLHAQGQAAGDGAVGGKASKADIAHVVRRKSAPIRRCYELGLLEDPQFRGTVEVQWRISVEGRVSGVSVVNASVTNRTVEACLVAEILRWEFAASSEPVVVGAYPFTFDSTLLARHPVPAGPAIGGSTRSPP